MEKTVVNEIVDVYRENLVKQYTIIPEWDNNFLIIGDETQKVNKVLLCVDVTHGAIDYAKQHSIDLIISHHPLIFNDIKSITNGSVNEKIKKLIKNDISNIAVHTPLDFSGRVKQELENVFEDTFITKLTDGCYSITFTEDKTVKEFLYDMKRKFYIYSGNIKRHIGNDCLAPLFNNQDSVKNILFCNGKASLNKVPIHLLDDYEFILVGEMDYHDILDLNEDGINIVEIGHAKSEIPLLTIMRDILHENCEDIDCFIDN